MKKSKEKRKEYHKKWYRKNEKEVKEYLKNWRKENPKKVKKHREKWNKNNKEKKAGRIKPKQCEICGAFNNIYFDHNHETGEFRGWICQRCNITLGLVKDSPDLLNALIKYLENNKKASNQNRI